MVGRGELDGDGIAYGGVATELHHVGLAGIAAPEASDDALQIAERVVVALTSTEGGTVEVVDDRDEAAAHRDSGLALPPDPRRFGAVRYPNDS